VLKTIKARGLVLKEYETGEADKRLLLLCKERGRIMAYARGARKPRSKFMAAAQIFTYSDFVLAEGNGFFSVAQAQVIENFYDLRTDYDTLCAAHFIADVCDKNLLGGQNCDALLLLVLKSLAVLQKQKFPPNQVTIVFLLRFFDFCGLRPDTSTPGILISANDKIKLSQSAFCAAEFILSHDLSQSFLFEASPQVLEELQAVAEKILKAIP